MSKGSTAFDYAMLNQEEAGASTSATVDNVAESEADGPPDRDVQVKERFLAGTLNIGPSNILQRHGKPVTFLPKGEQRAALAKWFRDHDTHKNHRSLNAQLVISKSPLPAGRRLSDERVLQVAPFDRVEVILYPCKNDSISGKKRGSTVLQTHENYDDTQAFYMRSVGRSKGDLGLLHLIQDTCKYKADLERAKSKTFQTPWPEDLVRAEQQQGLLPLPSSYKLRPLQHLALPHDHHDPPTPAEVLSSANEAVAQLIHQKMNVPTFGLVASRPAFIRPEQVDIQASQEQSVVTTSDEGSARQDQGASIPSNDRQPVQLSRIGEMAFASIYDRYIKAKAYLYPDKLPGTFKTPGKPVFHLARPEALPPVPPAQVIVEYERGRQVLGNLNLTEEQARALYEAYRSGQRVVPPSAATDNGGGMPLDTQTRRNMLQSALRSKTPESPTRPVTATASRKRQRPPPKKGAAAAKTGAGEFRPAPMTATSDIAGSVTPRTPMAATSTIMAEMPQSSSPKRP